MSHRWSGWPGAWCLDCGCEDPVEIAMADGNWEVDGDDGQITVTGVPRTALECPEPGSKRHDPYSKNADS